MGGASLEELKVGDLAGVSGLEELTVHANNLRRSGTRQVSDLLPVAPSSRCSVCGCRYEPGTLAGVWPLGGVTLSLRGPFGPDGVASALLEDVSYPETPLVLRDLNLTGTQAVQNLRAVARRRVR